MKKCLALLLSLLLVTVLFALSASAADPTITVGSANVAPGETVAIDVSLSNNPGINSFSLGFAYDEALLTLKTVTASPELGGQFTYAKKAVWLNSADSDYNGAILTLTFDTAADAAGTAEVAVTYEEGDIINYDEDDVSFAVAPGKITFQSAECDHQWDAGKVTKAATCKAAGVKTFTCSICKATKTETLPKTKDHKWDAGKVTTAASCTSQGVITYTCSVCKITKTAAIPATGHLWDAGKVTKAATCTSQGVKTYTCTVCKLTKMALIPYTGHLLTTKVTKEATCSSTGLETLTCSFCGATGGTNTIPKNPDNHNGYGTKTVNAKKATATTAGYTGDKVCKGCGAVLEKGKEIPKTGADEPAETDFRFELKKASLENGVLRVALSWKNGKGLKSGKAFVEYDSAVLKAKSFQWGADARRVYEESEDHDLINIASEPYADDNMIETGWYFYEYEGCETEDSFELLFLPFEVLDKTAASTELTLKTNVRFGVDDEEGTSSEQTVTIPLTETEPPTPDTKFKPGDVDGDGEVTSGDARLALRASVRLEKDITEGTNAYLAADADNDGEVTSGDARLILRASVGLEDLLSFRNNQSETAPQETQDPASGNGAQFESLGGDSQDSKTPDIYPIKG